MQAHRYLIDDPEAAVQYLATGLLCRGYRYHTSGFIPPDKDPLKIDAKLIQRYGCDASKWRRAANKANGIANVRYLRCGLWFVLVATPGASPFFEQERPRNARHSPIRFGGYSLSLKPDRANPRRLRSCVRVELEQYRELRAAFLSWALRNGDWLARQFETLPLAPFAPVCQQLHAVLRQVNRKRKLAGLDEVPKSAIRTHRKTLRVFIEPHASPG